MTVSAPAASAWVRSPLLRTPTSAMIGRFPVRFYLVAMLFVVFDVEAASFYPWAVRLRELGSFGLIEMVTFIVVLGIGYAYVWKKGGFSWR